MAKKIKLAVVGTSNNGKSHFINDVLQVLQDKGIGIVAEHKNNDSKYAKAYDYWTLSNTFKSIKLTDPDVQLTRNKNHFQGTSENGKFTFEFMDIPGEAFRNAGKISTIFTTLKTCLKECYTIPWHKRFIKNTPNCVLVLLFPFTLSLLLINGIFNQLSKLQNRILFLFNKKNKTNNHFYFIEERRKKGDKEILTIRLSNQIESNKPATTPQLLNNVPIDKEDSTPSQLAGSENEYTNYEIRETYYRTGKYVVKNFEKYETNNLIDVLKEVVKSEQSDTLSHYDFTYQVAEGENAKSIDISTEAGKSFWQHFYAYVFCETCTDFIICDLLAVHKAGKDITTDNFRDCVAGCDSFMKNKKNTKYLVFRGMDALLEQTEENNNILHKCFAQKTNKVELAPYIYFLIHLAIYKEYMSGTVEETDFTAFLTELKNDANKNRFIGKLEHLLTDSRDLQISLDSILRKDNNFVIPNKGSDEDLKFRLESRIKTFFGEMKFQEEFRSDLVSGVQKSRIFPHTYFTAYPIHKQTLKIYQNKMGEKDFYDNANATFDKSNRFPLGVYNFVADLLYQNEIGDHHKCTDMEILLYYKKS
jgi:hypothetical protein